MTAVGVGLLTLATLLFNRSIRALVPQVGTEPINVDDVYYEALKSRQEVLEGYFLQNRIIFDSVDKLSPVSNMAYSCLKKC